MIDRGWPAMMLRALYIFLLWFSLLLLAQAASFDCSKAVSEVERLICQNHELGKLDEELAQSYRDALEIAPEMVDQTGRSLGQLEEGLKVEQKAWLSERNKCRDVSCLKRSYEERLHVLIQYNPCRHAAEAGSVISIKICNAINLANAEESLRNHYDLVLQAIKGHRAASQSDFAEAQKTWLSFRNAQCTFEAPLTEFDDYSGCQYGYTLERIEALKKTYRCLIEEDSNDCP